MLVAAMVTVLVLFDVADLPALSWAARLSVAAGRPLRVLCATEAPQRHRATVNADQLDDETPPLVRAAVEAIGGDAAGETKDPVVHDCRGPDLRRAVLDAAAELEARDLVLASPVGETADARRSIVSRLARAAPDDVLLLDAGPVGGNAPARIVVPQVGGGGRHALRLATRGLGAGEAPVLAIPDPDKLARSRRAFGSVQERKPGHRAERLSQADPPEGPLIDAVSAVLQPGDLVLLDAEEAGRVPKLLEQLRKLRSEREDVPFAVAVARAADAAGPGRLERAVERLRMFVPVLDREQRKDLHERLEAGGRLSTDFMVMITLSAAIAALGLVQDSAAVVIGAMLVAPLMTPMVAAGLSLVQGNLALFRASVRAMSIGVAGAVAVSLVVGLLSPWDELSGQVMARGGPNLFDLGIAAFSGMAAAYALARPGLAGTLAGVAIAVALVPPLSATGIAAAKGEPTVAIGAAVLFVTNFFAIVLGAAMVFRFFGLQVARKGETAPAWVRGVTLSLMLGVVAVTAPLALNLLTQVRTGVSRPPERALPRDLREAIRARVAETGTATVLSMAQQELEPGHGVEIALVWTGPVDPDVAADVEAMVRAAMGERVPVRVLSLRAAG